MMKKSGTTFNDEINGAHCDPLYYYYYYYYYGSLNLDVNIKKLTWSTLATSRKLIFFFKRNRTPQFQVFFLSFCSKRQLILSRGSWDRVKNKMEQTTWLDPMICSFY